MNKLSAIFLMCILLLSVLGIYADPTYVENDNGWITVTFTEVGSDIFVIPEGVTEVEVLVVGGGGGAGTQTSHSTTYAGSGGAGGLILMEGDNSYIFSSSEISNGYVGVTVGDGGLGSSNVNQRASNGGDSTFGRLTAKGGGGGGSGATSGTNQGSGAPGGSGGGGAEFNGALQSGGAAIQPSQTGESGTYGWGTPGGIFGGGGTSGAGGGSSGRTGIHNSSGKTVWGNTYASGGTWFGGYFDAAPNTGNGANGPGSSSYTGGGRKGGSGIVIVRYIPHYLLQL
ncbi:MAG: glycine-rich domain-containing protein [Methanofastidiosum sp.]